MKVTDSGERIAIVRNDRLGDLVLTLPMACAIKIARPRAKVIFVVNEYTRPIAERCPDIDELIMLPRESSALETARILRTIHATSILFPPPNVSLALGGWLSGIPVRVGTAFRWYSFLFNSRIHDHRKTAERHESEYNLRMLSAISISSEPGMQPNLVLREPEVESTRLWLAENLNGESRFAVLHIGSGGSSKDWPVEKFVQLGGWIANELKLPIVLTGVEVDAKRLLKIAEELRALGAVAALFLDKTLPELATLLRSATLVIANSTGPGHLAAALGAPTIGLFPLPRALSKERWGFRGARAINLAPQKKADCPDCKDCDCMERLEIGDVEKVILKIMQAR